MAYEWGGGGRRIDPGDGYTYDAFISYRHEPDDRILLKPWIVEVVKRLDRWLGNGLGGRRARLFFDTDSVHVADRWPDRLREAIRTSRCLVPFLTPEYFQSPWCCLEWDSFVRRGRLAPSAGRLIAPLTLHDGASFPPEARAIQTLDVRRLVGTTPAFWNTGRADELDQLLIAFGDDLAEVVKRAPPYRSDWPIAKKRTIAPPRNVPREDW